MLSSLIILLLLSILSYTKYGRIFSCNDWKIYLPISAIFSFGLFFTSGLKDDFIFSIFSSLLAFIIFTLLGYLLLNELSAKRKKFRYLYFSAYFIFILAISYQYPFTLLQDHFKEKTSISLKNNKINYSGSEIKNITQKDIIEYYKPLAEKFGIKELEIHLLKDNTLGAFVISYGDKTSVVITAGLNKLLKRNETGFVMAHEFSHYKLGHHKLRILWSVIALFLFFLSIYGCLKLFRESYDGELRIFFKFIPVMLFFAIFMSVVPLWLSRNQEFQADLYAVNIMNDKETAIRTFEKIKKIIIEENNLFEIHPSMNERIEYIKNKK